MQLQDVQRNYGAAAGNYDFWANLIFHRLLGLYQWRERTIEALSNLQGARVLDIGCGTGNNFPLLMSRIGPQRQLVAVDYSEAMLEQAQARVRSAQWSNVTLLHDDAASLKQVEGPFDAALSVWCLGIVHDLSAALTNMLRLVRPGGRVAILDFDRSCPDHGLLRWLYPLYSRLLIVTGIDAPEDLDDARLQARWRRGLEILESNLVNLKVDRYFHDTGILVHGTKNGGGARPGCDHSEKETEPS